MAEGASNNTKAKLLLSLKSDISDVQASADDHKQQIEKLNKRLTQVTPLIDGVKDECSRELTKLRDELTEESQMLMKVVSWIRDKLDAKIDKKLETAQTQWLESVQKDNTETHTKMRTDFTATFEEGRGRWEERMKEMEREYEERVKSVKEEGAIQVAGLKDQWHHERTQLENKIESLEKEHKDYLHSKITGLYADAQGWVAAESDKASSDKALHIEHRVGQWQGDQEKKIRDEFERNTEHFQTVWRSELDVMRKEEAQVWERERRQLRDEEKHYRESLKTSVLEELSRFQKEALELLSTAQEELAKSRAKAPEFDEPEAHDDDEIFAIGKQLSEKQTRREKEKVTKQILMSPEGILRKMGEEEREIEKEQVRRDGDAKKMQEKREKV